MSDNELRQLAIPREVVEASNAQEFVRFWVADGVDHVTLYVGGFSDTDDEPYNWGCILADIAFHAVNGMQQNNKINDSSKNMIADIRDGFENRLAEKPDLVGELGKKQNAH